MHIEFTFHSVAKVWHDGRFATLRQVMLQEGRDFTVLARSVLSLPIAECGGVHGLDE
jgi:hypothetical protein